MAAPLTEKNYQSQFREKIDELLLKITEKRQTVNESDEVKESYEECNKQCQNLLAKLKTENLSRKLLTQHVQQFTTIVLDFTFVDENKLVNQEFPEDASVSIIQSIFNEFDNLLLLVTHLFPDLKPIESLGEELLECIYWRKGALLYMYCKTIETNKTRIQNNIQLYHKYLTEGVINLKQMMETRKPVDKNTLQSSNDDDSLDLLQSGIYSDTHVLSLVYGGELCYWLHQSDQQDIYHCSDIDYKQIGRTFLSLYIKVVMGPLKAQGWSVNHAQLMLQSLQS